MKLKKRSQITLMMAIAVVIIIIFSIFYFVSRGASKKKLEAEVSQELGRDIKPIKQFVQQCLEQTAKEGIVMLGRQGGRIRVSQGGINPDYQLADEGDLYIKKDDEKCRGGICYIPYYIGENKNPPASSVIAYNPKGKTDSKGSNIYPSAKFPYDDNAADDQQPAKFGPGPFGTDRNSLNRQDIKKILEAYIKNKINDCLGGFSAFVEQGFNVNVGENSVNVDLRDLNVLVSMNFPIDVEDAAARGKASFNEFSSDIGARLGLLFDIAEEDIAYRDRTWINHKPENKGDVLVNTIEGECKAKDYCRNDDIIVLTDTQSSIDGSFFKFQFARRNRAPALFYIFKDCIGKPANFKASDIVKEIIPSNYKCASPGCCPTGGTECMEKSISIDPDEDKIFADIIVNNGVNGLDDNIEPPATITLKINEDSNRNNVLDPEELSDWQIIQVKKSGDC